MAKTDLPKLEKYLDDFAPTILSATTFLGVACFLYLACTTCFYVYKSVSANLSESNTYLFWGIVAFACSAAYLLIDHNNFWMIVTRIKAYILQRNDSENNTKEDTVKARIARILLFVIVSIIVIRVGSSVMFTWWASPTLGSATSTNDTRYYVEQAQKAGADKDKQLTLAQKNYDELKASESDRIASAKSKGDKLYQKAYNNGQSWHRKSLDEVGLYGWLLNPANPDEDGTDVPYGRGIEKAINERKELIQAEKNKTLAALNAYNLLSKKLSTDSTVTILATIASRESKRAETEIANNTNVFYLGDIGASVIGFLCALLVALCEVYLGKFDKPVTVKDKLKNKANNFIKSAKEKASAMTYAVKDATSPVPLSNKPTTVLRDKPKKQHNGKTNKLFDEVEDFTM